MNFISQEGSLLYVTTNLLISSVLLILIQDRGVDLIIIRCNPGNVGGPLKYKTP